jgi:hypothetical protein
VTLTVTPPPPPTLSIAFNPSSLVAGETFTASWSSNGAATCNETGGLPNGAWGRASDGAPTGSVTEVASAGQFTFGLTCQSIDPALPAVTTQASLLIAALSETLASSATSVTNGSSFTLTWSSDANSCMASGGGANGSPWSGAQPTAGSVTQQATTNGSFTYTLECAIDHGGAIDQEVTIKVVAPSSGGSGGGGGGTLGVLEVALLLRLIRRRQRVS